MANRWVAGVDLGGTKVAAGAVSEEGRLAGRTVIPTRAERPIGETLADMVELVHRVLADAGLRAEDLAGIGIGAPGPLDPKAGIIHFAPNLGWREVPICRHFEENFPGVPIRLENDANAAALGEHSFGAGRGFSDMIYVTVSTGIGGGLILNNRLYSGATGGAGEIGHFVVERGGPPCGCGRNGCLESVASGTAIGRIARERVAAGGAGMLAGMEPGELDAAAVGLAARQGDPLAIEIIGRAFTYLGYGLADLVNVLNPKAIIVGGGVGALWDLMEPHIRRELNANCLEGFAEAVSLKKAELGTNVGVYGAAALFGEVIGVEPAY